MADEKPTKGTDAKAEVATTTQTTEPKVEKAMAASDAPKLDVPKVSEPPKAVKTPAATEPATDGYAKKGGALKWILIYLVIAAVAYGAYYYVAVAGNSSTGY